jgi:hypothetical protein
MGARAWQSQLPSVVVTPSPAINNSIRQDLAQHGVGLLGVEFVRPEDVRGLLAGRFTDFSVNANLQDLSAVMRQCALELQDSSPDNPTFHSMATAPDFLLDTVLLLASGGWTPASIPSADLRKVGLAFVGKCQELGIQFGPAFDMEAQGQAFGGVEPVFHEIAVVGFDASHWSLWGLLSAACLSSQKSSVWLPDWSIKAEEAEMIWFSSWEHLEQSEIFPLDSMGTESAMEDMALGYEASLDEASEKTLNAPLTLRVEADYYQTAKTVVGEILHLLSEDKRRICVAIPDGCFAGRSISQLLCDLGVEHFYAEGNNRSGVGESGAWNALLRYLETEEVTFLKAFFQALPTLPKAMKDSRVTTSRLVRLLERLRDQILTDQTEGILDQLKDGESRTEIALREFIRGIKKLPAKADIRTFCEDLESICRCLGWNERASMILDRLNSCQFQEGSFDKAVFIRWISEMASQRDRSELAGKAYAPVQIVPVEGAHLIRWDYVVFLGANEGVFPILPEYPAYIGVSDLRQLNERVKELNASAVTGNEDEAHVIAGHALCIAPNQERLMQSRNFSRILRNTAGMTLYAVAHDETDGGKEMFPSEVFSVCYALKHGLTLKQDAFQKLAGTHDLYSYPQTAKTQQVRLEEFEAARSARGDENSVFGDYDFSLMRPNHGVCIPASSWSNVNECPEIIFLRYFLGVDLSEEGDDFQWSRAVGIWAHRILSEAIGTGSVPLPRGDEWRDKVLAAGNRLKADFETLAEASGAPTPGWLAHLLSQAQSIAVRVAKAFGSASLHAYGYTHIFTEWPLDVQYDFKGNPIHCLGGIDFLLTDNPESFEDAKVAVLDVKTGSDKKLSVATINRGAGAQVVSYGLGMKALGAKEVRLGIVTPDSDVEPQVSIDDLSESMEDTEGLGGILTRIAYGDLGHEGTVRDRFSFYNRLPLATMPIREKKGFRSQPVSS